MKWNWQQPDWPQFTYEASRIEHLEALFLRESGFLAGTFQHLNDQDREQLTIELVCTEALQSSAIEGEYLDRDSVQSSICRQFGLATDQRRVEPKEQGMAEMIVDLYRYFALPLDHETLFKWHHMVTLGRTDLNDVGRYRTQLEPMQIVSGAVYAPTIHFEAPPVDVVAKEMERFIDWFNRTAPNETASLPILIRAGITHLWFVSIHPFEDGNGRTGRALAEKALAQGLGQPTLIALADTLKKRRKAYYDALEATNKNNSITEWLYYFACTVIDAQRITQARLEMVIEKTKFYDCFRGELNARQEKVIARLFQAEPEGFTGGLSAEKYISLTKTSRATATRDLHELVEMGALIRTGERKHTRYALSIRKKPIVMIS